ncbi:hypothetical protein M407DRAFT_78134, partial [Tulasnella calospora MUT 4182]
KMSINVLVYNGPGVSQTSVSHTLHSLRTLLRPNYSVNAITPQALINDPWPASCALLVIPGGRDTPYVSALEKANPKIKDYVKLGGSFLGICAGGYYGSARVEWEVGTPLEVVGDRALAFFPGVAKGCAFEGFVYESEAGARAIDILVNATETPRTFKGIYYNGGGYFENAENLQSKGVRVLSTYTQGIAKGKAAAVACDIGAGRAILMGPHMEYPITLEPAAEALRKSHPDITDSAISELERARWDLMKMTLELLGLLSPYKTSEDVPSRSQGPLPQVLVSAPSKPFIVPRYLDALRSICPYETPNRLQDANDTFNFHPSANFNSLLAKSRERRVAEGDLGLLERDVVIYEEGSVPTRDQTPLFNLEAYFDHLSSVRSSLSSTGKEELKKLGGILVTTNFSGGLVDVVIGCGINVLNPLPTTSLSQLVPPGAQSELTMEKTIATIMPVFEQMWDTFLSQGGSFEPFMDLYLTRWLHSDQVVTLTTVTPQQTVRIVGITPDYGLLRTIPERGGVGAQFIDLQPDGNSFDMMAGLIKLKQ